LAYKCDEAAKRRRVLSSRKLWQILAAVVGAAAAIGAISFALTYFQSTSTTSQIDRATEQVKELPLVGLVLSEHPDLEARVRQAIKDGIEHPTKSGPNQGFVLGAEIRKQYIVPALRNSDDNDALEAVRDMSDLVKHLRVTDMAVCREFGLSGLQRPDKLDDEGAAIFKRTLAAEERAYISGKDAPPRLAPSSQEVTNLLTDAGYSPTDFQTLAGYAKLPQEQACAAIDKLYAAPAQLQTAKGAIIARYLLTVSQ
jgi:hypothetical protein